MNSVVTLVHSQAKAFAGSMLAVCTLAMVAVVSLNAAEPIKAANGSLFAQTQVPSLGKLAPASGDTVTFSTGTAEAAPAVSGAVTGAGVLGRSQSGTVEVAIFAFDEIQLPAGVTVEITGDRGLILLSRGAVMLDTTLSLAGSQGGIKARSGGGSGGPGGEGGERDKALASSPPPANGGDGSEGMKDSGASGTGFGAGFNRRVKGGAGGGGGAYGGAGGASSEGSGGGWAGKTPKAMPGGNAYGDAPLADLLGGSGGAGGSNDRNFDSAAGGGGGGAIGIIATGPITIGASGQILATGAAGRVNKVCGGGGSGGGILLAAPTITLISGASVNASGGAGGDGGPDVIAEIEAGKGRRNAGSGGGGGGGRIAFYDNAGNDQVEETVPEGVAVAGGTGGTGAAAGSDGTFYHGKLPNRP